MTHLLLRLLPSAHALSPTRPGDLTLTEFQADTTVVAQYYGEWFEVRNNTSRTIDLQGVTFTCSFGSFTVETSVGVLGGQHAVLGLSRDTTLNGGLTDVDYIYPFSSFNLARSADAIRVEYGGVLIDEVAWTSAWPTSPDESHQVSRNAMTNEWANDLVVNWCPSTAYISGSGMRGTPGEQNRYCSDTPGEDSDGDGYTETGGDCDDTDPTVNPGEVDDAGADRYRRDDDCDGVRDDGEIDDDLDGFTEVDGDCDDETAGAYPGAAETVDGLDNDCDGCVDDLDDDGDGWTECEEVFDRNGDGDTSDAGDVARDCNDENERVNPEARDVPYDGVDQDCNGADLCDYDGDGWLSVECPNGTDCDDNNADINPAATEDLGDGIDNDCDGEIDVPDRDGDGFAALDGDCMDVSPEEDPVLADLAKGVNPSATEVCGDGLDNDCDGFIDNLAACANPAASATVRGGGLCGVVDAPASGVLLTGMAMTAMLARRRRGGAA